MATVTLGIATTSVASSSSYALTTFTPAVGDIIVLCLQSNTSGQIISASDNQGGNYSDFTGPLTGVSGGRAFIFVRDTKVASAVGHIITVSVSGGATGLIGISLRVAGLGNRTGTSLRKQNQGSSATTGTPTLTFNNNVLTQDPVIAFISNTTNPATLTPPTSWTEDSDVGTAAPLGMEVVHINSGFTSTAVTWGSASATTYIKAGIELDVSSVVRGQAQAQIKGFPTRVAQAKANIVATSNTFGQAQAQILGGNVAVGQAQADIEVTFSRLAQAQGMVAGQIQAYPLLNFAISSGPGVATYTTSNYLPTAGRLLIATVYHRGLGAVTANIPTIAGNNQTWTQFVTGLGPPTDNTRRVTAWWALVSSPTVGGITWDWAGQLQTTVAFSIVEYSGTDIGSNGANSVVQAVMDSSSAIGNSSFIITLAAFGSTKNSAIGYMRDSFASNITTAGPNFVIVDSNYILGPTINIWSPVADPTVEWDFASTTQSGEVITGWAAELKAAPAQVVGQAQAYIKLIDFSSAQSQADIKQTYNGLAQAQTDIKATISRVAQAQADIKQTYSGLAQVQADIKQTYSKLAQAQADIKQTFSRIGQSQADIKATISRVAQSQADIKQTYYGLGQSNADIQAVNNGFGQAQGYILLATTKSAQAQAAIDTGIYDAVDTFTRSVSGGWGTANVGGAWTPTDAILSVDGSKGLITPTGATSLIPVSLIGVTAKRGDYLKVRFKTSDPTASGQNISFYSVINQSINGILGRVDTVTGVFTVLIGASASSTFFITIDADTWYWVEIQHIIPLNSSPLVRGKIWKDGDPEPGWQVSRTAFLSPTGKVGSPSIRSTVGLSNTEIHSFDDLDYHPIDWSEVGQAQATIIAVGNGFGQAQADIKVTSNGLGQVNSDIKVTSNGLAQAQADILQTSFVSAQAQADILQSYFGEGQTQANIVQTYYGLGQAQAKISISETFGFGQAQGTIFAESRAYGQAQGTVGTRGQAYGQSQGAIKTTGSKVAQAQARVLATSVGLAQAQGDVKQTYVGLGQAQATIVESKQRFGQVQASIKVISIILGQAQSDIQQTYTRFAQAQAVIKTTGYVFAQAQAYINLINVVSGQAQADILTSKIVFAQAQAQIGTTNTKTANAQADIKVTVNYTGQANAQIKQYYEVFAQAQASILAVSNKFAQVQASILTNYYGLGQAEAFILKSAGYGQAQAYIIFEHILKTVVASDRPSLRVVGSDRELLDILGTDQSLKVTATDRPSLRVVASDRSSITIVSQDEEY